MELNTQSRRQPRWRTKRGAASLIRRTQRKQHSGLARTTAVAANHHTLQPPKRLRRVMAHCTECLAACAARDATACYRRCGSTLGRRIGWDTSLYSPTSLCEGTRAPNAREAHYLLVLTARQVAHRRRLGDRAPRRGALAYPPQRIRRHGGRSRHPPGIVACEGGFPPTCSNCRTLGRPESPPSDTSAA